jgi:hypothetical protein
MALYREQPDSSDRLFHYVHTELARATGPSDELDGRSGFHGESIVNRGYAQDGSLEVNAVNHDLGARGGCRRRDVGDQRA